MNIVLQFIVAAIFLSWVVSRTFSIVLFHVSWGLLNKVWIRRLDDELNVLDTRTKNEGRQKALIYIVFWPIGRISPYCSLVYPSRLEAAS